MPNMRTRERVLGTLAVFGAFIGGLGLILLSVFDTSRHTKAHRVFLLVFMLGVALSAIFTVFEVCRNMIKSQMRSNISIQYRWISKDFKGIESLKRAYRLKLFIAVILIILAAGFAGSLFTDTQAAQKAGGTLSRLGLFVFDV